jgi:hypothetical protein
VWFGTALIAFWPSTIIAGCRLHNDSLANALVVAAVYFLLRYGDERNWSSLFWATALTVLGLLTKSSASVAVALWGFVVVLLPLARRMGWKWVCSGCVASALLLGLAAWRLQPMLGPGLCQRFVGRACRSPWLELSNTPRDFVTLDIGEFVSHPYLVVSKGATEMSLFWNVFLKSSLFGIYREVPDTEIAYFGNVQIATALNWLLLLMLAYAVALVWKLPYAWYRRRANLIFVSVVSVASVMTFRAVVPNTYHGEFRHVQGLLVWSATLFVSLLESQLSGKRWLYRVGVSISALMIVGSAIYFVPKQSLFACGPAAR